MEATGSVSTESPPNFEPVELSRAGIKVPPRLIWIVIAVVVGGGGGGAAWFNLASDQDVEDAAEAVNAAAIDREQKQLRLIEVNIDRLNQHGKAIKDVTQTVDSIQDVQQSQVARDEARRLTAGIANRDRREREYDRIRARNLDRLRRGLEPCGSLSCGR